MRQTKIGRYELLHKIAAGGMAEVFLARQWGHGGFFRDVVIKRLFAHFGEHEHALRMFQDEARLLSELSHPNIPQVYDLGYSDGHWFLAMEHVGGASLAELCQLAAKAQRPVPLPVAIAIISQVCAALHHAHERCDREGRPLRIVHRDVTPHNIMVSLDAVVKVLDFGVAQTSARIDTDAGAVRGTYAYMAPEQVRGRPLDKRADVFALGINLYELTTGRRLFRGNDVEVMTAVVERDVTRPTLISKDYPADLEDIVMCALRRDRVERTPSAAHLAHNLDQFCMRHGIVTSALVVSQYVRSVFPYARAREARIEVDPGGGAGVALSDEELEVRLLREELQALQASGATIDMVSEVEELPEELLIEEEDTDIMTGKRDADGVVALEHLGLDAFDEDSDVKPVVLLSPKATQATGAAEGSFLGDLARRLQEDGEPPPPDKT